MKLPYDITSANSLLDYSKNLYGKSLSELIDFTDYIEDVKNKGGLGQLVEKYFFNHVLPNTHDPDFMESGVELKTTGVVKKKDASYKAKERLVLTMINYLEIVKEDWNTSSLVHKCKLMLILFYLYDKDKAVIDRKFVLNPILWDFPEEDIEIIKQDWLTIVNKIKLGKAHELSEGDTYYLTACRKESGGIDEKLRKQPFSKTGAKSRAFSLKPSYVNKMIDSTYREESLIANGTEAKYGIEKIVSAKISKFIGKTDKEIAKILDYKTENSPKSFHRTLVMRMLGTKKNTIPEFEKADIEIKVVRVDKNFKPKEDMSFPIFRYMDIVNENWEESSFYDKLEKKFFFVVFQFNEKKELVLAKTMFWNMPYDDRLQAEKVWEKTKSQIANGHAETLPKKSDNSVAHVRPHARNAKDTLPTPQFVNMVKKCFWLNSQYIQNQIKNASW